jgi:serine/threonine-protein kinase
MSHQAPKPSQADELIGRVVNDRFRILSVIARGGMGRVYRAEQVPLGRLVAVKTLDPRHADGDQDPSFQQRFFLEASVASKLQHPNTVTVFDYGRTSDGIYFIAMELVEGRSLFNLIREEAPLAPARVVHIAMQIARSLREAHRLDVIHRDLKPGNVLLTRHGDEEDFVKVLDFGLVKQVESEAEQELTQAGLFMGSPKYMSPEQIRGERVDARSDIYSLGVVMYEMLTGRAPFERENTVKLLMAHMHEAVPALQQPGVPPALGELVQRCLAKHPDQRPSSMDEVILLLKQATGVGTQTLSGQYQLSQEVRLSGTPPGSLSAHPLSGQMMVNRLSQSFPSGVQVAPGATPSTGFSDFDARVDPRSSSASWGQPPVPSPTSGAAPGYGEPAPTGWLPKLAVIGALTIAAGFLALRFSEKSAPGTASASAIPAPGRVEPSAGSVAARAAAREPDQAAALPAAPAAAPQHHTIVTITSVPTGAKIVADNKAYGETPANIEWWGELAKPGREVTFTLQKDGYEKVTLVRVVQGELLAVEASLPRIASRRRSDASRLGKAPVIVPEDFKDDPY